MFVKYLIGNQANCRSGINQKFSRSIIYLQVYVYFYLLVRSINSQVCALMNTLMFPSGAQVSREIAVWD
jgi:hypothetical protein